ncbi:MAG: hypothetical protein RLZZ336_2243, partial [Cyanobacteriota bacterium]
MQAQREAAAIDGVVLQSSLAELELPAHSGSGGAGPDGPEAAGRVLLVLDTRIANWQELVDTLPERTELLLLEPNHSGLQQIGEQLGRQPAGQGYGALVLVLPQQGDGLALGSDQLTEQSLQGCAEKLQQWRRGLLSGAQLNLVVAGGEAMAEPLLAQLAALTGTTPVLTQSPTRGTGVSIGAPEPALLEQARMVLANAQQSGQLEAALVRVYGEASLAALQPVIERFVAGELAPLLHRASFADGHLQGVYVASHGLILIDQQLGERGLPLRAAVLQEVGRWLADQAALEVDGSQALAQQLLNSPAEVSPDLLLLAGTELLTAEAEHLLQQALLEATQVLVQQHEQGALLAVLQSSFGAGAAALSAEQLDALLAGLLLSVEVVPAEVMGVHRAGYAAIGHTGSERIYVNAAWLQRNPAPELVVRVLLEELGHALDERLNPLADSPGDEGKVFAALVLGQPLSEAERLSLVATNDTTTLNIKGVLVALQLSANAPVLDLDPTVNGVDRAVVFTEVDGADTGANAVAFTAAGTSISDADVGDLLTNLQLSFSTAAIADGAAEQLLINNATAGGFVPLNFANAASIADVELNGVTYAVSASVSGGTSTLTFTKAGGGTLTHAQGEALLDAFRYNNTTDTATEADRVFTVTVSDSVASSAAATLTLVVAAVNDAPTVSLAGGTLQYLPVSINVNNNNYSISYRTGTFASLNNNNLLAQQTWWGSQADAAAFRDAYSAAVSSAYATYWPNHSNDGDSAYFAYSLSGQYPLVELFYGHGGTWGQVYDGSTVYTFAVVDASSGSQVIDSSLSLDDVDNTSLIGAVVAISSGFRSSEDVLSFTNSGGITSNWDPVTGKLTLSGSASIAAYEEALESVTYTNLSATPIANDRTITWTVSDGSASSNVATSTILIAANAAPTNTVPGAQTVNEDTALSFNNGNGNAISVSDVDGNLATTQLSVSNGTLTVTLGSSGATISAGASGSSTLTLSGSQTQINAALATLIYQGNANFNGSDTLTMLSTDGAGTPLSDTDTVAITVSAVDDAPVQTGTIPPSISVLEDSGNSTGVSLGLSGLIYSPGGDSDETSQTFTYTLTGIPAFVEIYQADGTTQVTSNSTLSLTELKGLTYKTLANANGTGNLTWTVQDSGGTANGGSNTLNQALAITVAAVNDAPVRTSSAPGAIIVNEDSNNTTAISLGLSSLAYAVGAGSDESAQSILAYTV